MHIYFYATRKDLLELITLLEEKQKVRYVLMGNFLINEPIVTLDTLLGPDLGVSSGRNDPRYMVCPDGVDIVPSPVLGGHRYVVEPRNVAGGIHIRPGGQCGDGILIESETYNTFTESPLAKFFGREIRKRATKIRYAYVCREAEQLLDQGWRLVQSASAPKEYGLTRPPVLEYENKGERLSYLNSCQFLLKHEIDDCSCLFAQGWDGSTEPPMQSAMPNPYDEKLCGIRFFKTILDGEKDCQINLENLTLPRTYINRTGLRYVRFAGTDLSQSFMCWNDFEDCDFTSANLSGCDMRASLFSRCKFRKANLRGADFRWSKLTGCDFTDADMTGTIFDDKSTYKPLWNKLSEAQREVITWEPHSGPEPPGG